MADFLPEIVKRAFARDVERGNHEDDPLAAKLTDEPALGDVAVHPHSERYHDPDAVAGPKVLHVPEKIARSTLGLGPCPHCVDVDTTEVCQ